MKAAKVAIIGIGGKYGGSLERFFTDPMMKELVASVFGSDICDVGIKETNREVASRADVVIVAVPPRVTVAVIREIAPVLKKDQLIMDITSIKVGPVEAMLESLAEVRGLHPMCAPPRFPSWRGETIAVVDCPGRLEQWRPWSDEVLRLSGARLEFCSPEEHDRQMGIVQGLTHATNLVMASVIQEMGVNVLESLKYTSPVYRINLSLIGRILKQDPALYADIQMLNPQVAVVLENVEKKLKQFREVVEAGDPQPFIDNFLASRKHFGSEVVKENFELFELLKQLLVDHGSEDRVALDVSRQQNQPGVLHRITGVFLAEGINLVSFRSFRIGDDVRFVVVLDRPPQAPEVQRALANIAHLGLAVVR